MPLTSNDVALLAFPYFKKCIVEAKDMGFFFKLVSRPFWFNLTKIGVEVGVVLTKPKLEPILDYLVQLLPLIPEKYLVGIDKNFLMGFLELLKTPAAQMHPAVQSNFPQLNQVAHYPTMTPEDLANLIRSIENG